jgi:integrase/recombinase XerD
LLLARIITAKEIRMVELPLAKKIGHFSISDALVPAMISSAGEHAKRRFVEFFAARIRNRNTREAYARAVQRFCDWCERRNFSLELLEPVVVAAYIEEFGCSASKPTVKQHLAAIRMLFDYLVVGQIVPVNPAASVRGPKYSLKRGKTPVLSAEDTRKLLDSIDTSSLRGLRDRALIAVMVFSFARVSAVTAMNVEDFYQNGRRCWFRFQEKGGKFHEVPAHHTAEAYLDAYVHAAGLTGEKKTPLFRTSPGKAVVLTGNRFNRKEALAMIKRRAAAAGLPANICNHTFRATGITTFLLNGGTVEKAQAIAGHESPRTTKLYDRRNDEVTLDEIERILI